MGGGSRARASCGGGPGRLFQLVEILEESLLGGDGRLNRRDDLFPGIGRIVVEAFVDGVDVVVPLGDGLVVGPPDLPERFGSRHLLGELPLKDRLECGGILAHVERPPGGYGAVGSAVHPTRCGAGCQASRRPLRAGAVGDALNAVRAPRMIRVGRRVMLTDGTAG